MVVAKFYQIYNFLVLLLGGKLEKLVLSLQNYKHLQENHVFKTGALPLNHIIIVLISALGLLENIFEISVFILGDSKSSNITNILSAQAKLTFK